MVSTIITHKYVLIQTYQNRVMVIFLEILYYSDKITNSILCILCINPDSQINLLHQIRLRFTTYFTIFFKFYFIVCWLSRRRIQRNYSSTMFCLRQWLTTKHLIDRNNKITQINDACKPVLSPTKMHHMNNALRDLFHYSYRIK